MSARLTRWLLWLAAALTLPLPYYMIEAGRIPLVQLLLFSLLTVPLAFTDPGLTTRVVAALFAAQAVFYAAALSLAARAVARRLPAARRGMLVGVIAAALLLLAASHVYVAPLSHGSRPTNWRGLWP
ncbi:MAG: hypothetical protein SF182_03030 [Deltaproteobacteria bacterium]|nr:hypothetical protein [Deltaproteobacteria bacterium]